MKHKYDMFFATEVLFLKRSVSDAFAFAGILTDQFN